MLSGVSKTYGDNVIYDDFELEVKRGERWCVMGINGSGKSTLLKMIAGVTRPDSGAIRLGAALKMGYFAQSALEVLDPNRTVWEQIDEELYNLRKDIGESDNVIDQFPHVAEHLRGYSRILYDDGSAPGFLHVFRCAISKEFRHCFVLIEMTPLCI